MKKLLLTEGELSVAGDNSFSVLVAVLWTDNQEGSDCALYSLFSETGKQNLPFTKALPQ